MHLETDARKGDIQEPLRSEILKLFQYVQRLRLELATIAVDQADRTHFETMSDQLDAIVQATEDATNTILESVEAIGDDVAKLRALDSSDAHNALYDDIVRYTTNAFQACTFQDVTGQRVSKVVRSMKFVEERVDVMAEFLGREEIQSLQANIPAEEKEGEETLLNGPQLAGDAITQDEIDRLF